MKFIKKIIAFSLTFFTFFSCFACEEYIQATHTPGMGSGGGKEDGSEIVGPSLNDDPTDDFIVTVTADGNPYSPRMDMNVYWRDLDGSKIYTAPLNENGVARIDGLDGDFQVSLSAVPNEYSYNPNAYVATNDNRNITLNLSTLNRLTGSGTGMYDCYHFTKTGVYSAVIEKPTDRIFFEYAPESSGVYRIESWADVAEDNVNPFVDIYLGSSQWKQLQGTTNDGGASGSYTINFVHTVEIAKEMISGGGQATYTFAVGAETKNGRYPVTITFAVIQEKDDYNLWEDGLNPAKSVAVPKFDFSSYNVADHTYNTSASGDYQIVYPEVTSSTSTIAIFDDDLFALWKKSEGGDNFYHVYDEEKYPETNGYGPILYASITSACRFVDRAFNKIEYKDGKTGDGATTINNELTVNGVNYKHFIEGYTALTTYNWINGGTYYCSGECPCHNKNTVNGWACTEQCLTCLEGCRRILPELIGNEGYASIANSHGGVAVTEELKEFLSAYCDSAKYFNDGQGWIDGRVVSGKNFQAEGGSGWLFACYYYQKKA